MYFNENYSVRDSRRLVLEPEVFGDDRGLFFESFNKKNVKRPSAENKCLM